MMSRVILIIILGIANLNTSAQIFNNAIGSATSEILAKDDPIDSFKGVDFTEVYNTYPSASFSVGDKWTYDDYFYSDVLFQNYEILREQEWMGRQALVVRPGNLDSEDYMLQEGSKVYFWDKFLEEYQLNYDFDNDSLYIIRYYNSVTDSVDSTTVYVDSIRNVEYNGEDLQVQYCRSNFGFSGNSFTQKIIRNIGNSTFGPRLPISIIIDDFSGGVGAIRCFESSDCNIQFVDFPCDTTFITSVLQPLDVNEINIHPNPTQDKLYLDTQDQNWQYKIYNLQGQQMMHGVYADFVDVATLPSGIYFLQLQREDELFQAIKFVKE